jgi:hypothetical protein
MAEASVAVVPPAISDEVRRFELPDLDRHAKWFMARFLQAFPHLNERLAIGFLRGIIYNNEYMFLFQEHGVALAQMMQDHALGAGTPVIWERFVWVEDPTDVDMQKAAATFYTRFVEWGQRMGVRTMVLEESSDVPSDRIKALVGRVFERTQRYARL